MTYRVLWPAEAHLATRRGWTRTTHFRVGRSPFCRVWFCAFPAAQRPSFSHYYPWLRLAEPSFWWLLGVWCGIACSRAAKIAIAP